MNTAPPQSQYASFFNKFLEHIHRDDNFFAIGGNSLLAVQVKERLREDSGSEISVQSIIEYPVLKEMVARLGNLSDEPDAWHSFTRVLPLRTTGTKAPLFCIHAMSGLGWPFAGMLSGIDKDRPVYGLQAKGFAGEPLPRNMDEVTNDYIELIRQVQPAGPYHITGWCFGGYIAHSIATQLQVEGEEVAFLGLLNTRLVEKNIGPQHPKPHRDPANRDFIRKMAVDNLRAAGLGGDHIQAELIERNTDIRINNVDVIQSFRPKVFQGDLFLARATVVLPGPSGSVTPPTPIERWSRYISGDFNCVDFETDNDSLLYAGKNAALVGAAIDRALAALHRSETVGVNAS
jgi:thioesterase domain-containing protein